MGRRSWDGVVVLSAVVVLVVVLRVVVVVVVVVVVKGVLITFGDSPLLSTFENEDRTRALPS